MSGSAPSNTSTTSTTELPAWAQPYATALLGQTAALADQSMPVYTGQRTADLNGYQQASQDMIANRALNGSTELAAGSQQLTDTLGGKYLDSASNPYLQSAVDQASQDLTRNYQSATNNSDSQFARSGAFGGSAWNQQNEANSRSLATGLGNVATTMNYQNYNDERARQQAALSLAPTYGNQAYTDAAQLASAGQTQSAYDQSQLTDAQNQWTEQAQSPYKQLDLLGNGIRAAVGGGSSQSSSVTGANNSSGLATGIGSASALYGLLK